MMILTNLVMTTDPLVRTNFALFLCIFMSPLVVLVFWHLTFCNNRSWVQMLSTPCIILARKVLTFPPNLKISFITLVWLCSHFVSNCCSFNKNVIQCAPMGDIRRPSKFGSRGLEDGAFIQFLRFLEPQSHKLWCCYIDSVFREVHHTARVYIPDGTVR